VLLHGELQQNAKITGDSWRLDGDIADRQIDRYAVPRIK